MSKTTTFRSKKSLKVGAAMLASTLAFTDAPPALAATAPPTLRPPELDQALNYIKEGLRPFQIAQSIFGVLEFLNIIGGEGPGIDLVAELDRVQDRLIEEIQFWELGGIDTATTEAFRKYEEFLRNPGQTERNRQKLLYLTGSSDGSDAGGVYAELERLMYDADPEISMHIAIPFNTLTVMMAHALVWQDSFYPGEPITSWATMHHHYSRTFQANYDLVKVSRIMCYPGYNPELGDIVMEHDNVFETSRLYRHRSNKYFDVTTPTCRQQNLPVLFNPITDRIQTHCRSVLDRAGLGIKQARTAANEKARSDFRTADDVDALRDATRNLRFLSGGDYWNGIEGDMNNSEFFDPWVYEPGLCAAQGSAAYVQRP